MKFFKTKLVAVGDQPPPLAEKELPPLQERLQGRETRSQQQRDQDWKLQQSRVEHGLTLGPRQHVHITRWWKLSHLLVTMIILCHASMLSYLFLFVVHPWVVRLYKLELTSSPGSSVSFFSSQYNLRPVVCIVTLSFKVFILFFLANWGYYPAETSTGVPRAREESRLSLTVLLVAAIPNPERSLQRERLRGIEAADISLQW